MNTDTLKGILERIDSLEQWVTKSSQVIESLKIDKQLLVNKDQKLKPGIACKIAYNSDGLVIGVEKLVQSDLPEITIDQISGLRSELDDKLSSSEIADIRNTLNTVYSHTGTVSTGCKVNIDEHGFVNGVHNLLPDDIPTLPISKIDGLQTVLDHLNSLENNRIKSTSDYRVNPGTGCKLDYDEYGRIINKHDLCMDDIPSELISRLNIVESNISTLASQKSLTNLSGIIVNKLDSNTPITPGIYTKIVVDSKGLVVKGDVLDKEDLPSIDIQDVSGLRQELNSKADRSDVVTLNETVSSLVSSITRLGDIQVIKDQFESKADNSELVTLKNQVSSLKTLLDTLISSMPSDQFLKKVDDMLVAINTIEGRLSYLESKN